MMSRRVTSSAVAVSARRGTPGKRSPEDAEVEILRPEVVAPLRYAVRFIDGDERQLHRPKELQAARGEEPLGRNIQKVERPPPRVALHPCRLGRAERRVQVRRPHPELAQRRHLILHERDERDDHHQPHPRPQERRQLVTQRLARAGRHEHKGIAAVGDVLDDCLLLVAERVIAVDRTQELTGARPAGTDRGSQSWAQPWWPRAWASVPDAGRALVSGPDADLWRADPSSGGTHAWVGFTVGTLAGQGRRREFRPAKLSGETGVWSQ